MAFGKYFTEHPASVDETYAEHFRVATSCAGSLAIAAGAALVHAVVPALCEKTASRRIKALHARVTSGARAETPDVMNAA
ncbi:DUF6356 family protein [Ilumatobacter nonamiensis]|uniref:DUF6356 family protein n=1 Tax=Ilumatobacter nonamiensis TaxID=467093 RepID=UPI00034A871C|nr:DUF6356 family protein [Ilumatobacter nonamiensis]